MTSKTLRLRATVTVKAAGDGRKTFTFTATTGGVDRTGEIVSPKGGDFAAWLRNPVILYNHEWGHPPIGRGLSVTSTDTAHTIEVEFAPREIHPLAGMIADLAEAGFINACSIGFRTTDSERGPDGVYVIKSWEMLELSIVNVPANADALIAGKAAGKRMAALYKGDADWSERMSKADMVACKAFVAPKAEEPAPVDPIEALRAEVKALRDLIDAKNTTATSAPPVTDQPSEPAVGDVPSEEDPTDEDMEIVEALAALADAPGVTT